MGMFDDLRCRYPLPFEGANDLSYQTKDLDCMLDNYEIREDGTLWHEAYDTRVEENAEAFFGFYIHRDNKRWEQVNLTGEVRFYVSLPLDPREWLEWSAYFTDGRLRELHRIAPVAPQSSDARLTTVDKGKADGSATDPDPSRSPSAHGSEGPR